MKNRKTALLYNEWIEQIIIHYGDEDVKGKLESVKNFLKDNFQIDEFENTYIEIKRLPSKSFMWLLLSLIIYYEAMKQNPKNLHGFGESTSQKMEIPEELERQEKYISLEVDKVFPFQELTEKEVEFVEICLDKLYVDLESEFFLKYIISSKQLILLIRGIMEEHTIFLGNGGKIEE